jgi:hypothetical protein
MSKIMDPRLWTLNFTFFVWQLDMSKMSSYELHNMGRSRCKTWYYRLACNHTLKVEKFLIFHLCKVYKKNLIK